jgi:hypothetical protein
MHRLPRRGRAAARPLIALAVGSVWLAASLAPSSADAGPGLKLKPKKAKAAKKIRRALKRGRKPRAKLTVKLTDEAGNSESTRLKVKLKR